MTRKQKRAYGWTFGALALCAAILGVSTGPPALTSDLYIDQPAPGTWSEEVWPREDTPSATPDDRRAELTSSDAEPVYLFAFQYDRVTFTVYATMFDQRTTASGEVYEHYRADAPYTCASNDYPIGTWLRCRIVTREESTQSSTVLFSRAIVCRVNDRMADRFTGNGYIDLSGGAMAALDPSYDFSDDRAGLLRGDVAVLTDEEARRLIGEELWGSYGR